MEREIYYCEVCDWETENEDEIDEYGHCESCNIVECDECGDKYNRHELINGLCGECKDELDREYEIELMEREREFMQSSF